VSGWQRSSFCSYGACVEVLVLPNGWVHLRSSTQPERIALVLSPDEWEAFTAGVKADEFGVPRG
jgi:hypothetical protein